MRGVALFVVLAQAVLLAGTVRASDEGANDGNFYSVITERNAFHLVPAPPPPAAPTTESKAPEAGTIKLTGLMRVAGEQPQALFVSATKDPKGVSYFNLREGEREGALELVRILEDEGGAEVILAGNRQILMLKDNKPTGSPLPVVSKPELPALPPALAKTLSGGQMDQLTGSWLVMSEGQKEALLADAEAGRPIRVPRVTGPAHKRQASAEPQDETSQQ